MRLHLIMPKLSIIIITKNEAHDIRATLESIKWADEIVVLDSGSTDNTVAICREYTAKVYETDWPGFGPQKNRALNYAAGDWVLSIDADERVSPELKQEIQQALINTHYDGFYIPRKSTYCGKLINYGAWSKDKKLLLFKRTHGKFTDDVVHERLIVTGKIGKLIHALYHDTYQDLSEMLEKMNSYSSYSAQQRSEKNKPGGLFPAITHGLWAFIYSYFLKLGLLDGKEGFMLAFSNAEYTYYRYLKLMYLNQKK